jgi:hypothetical protein
MILAFLLLKNFFDLRKFCFLVAHLFPLGSLFFQLFHRHHPLEIIVPEAGVGAKVIRNRLGMDSLELLLIKFLGQDFEYILSHMTLV